MDKLALGGLKDCTIQGLPLLKSSSSLNLILELLL